MPQSKTDYVFISYSRRDDEVMRRIVSFLREKGINAWVDNEKLVPGTPIWEREIEKAIKGSSAAVVILSPDAKESVWVLNELTLVDEYRKRVFPVLVRGDFRNSVPFRLATRQFVDLRENEKERLNSLSTAISFHLEEMIRIEEERLAAEKTARDAEEKAEAEKKAKEEAERLNQIKAEEERLVKEKQEKKESAAKARQKEKETAPKSDKTPKQDPIPSVTDKLITYASSLKILLGSAIQKISATKWGLGAAAILIVSLIGLGLNTAFKQAPLFKEEPTPTYTQTATKKPTATRTKTPTASPTDRPSATPTKTKTKVPTSTPNLAATQHARETVAAELVGKSMLAAADVWSIKLSEPFNNNNNNWNTSTLNSEYGKGELKITDGKYRWTYTTYKGVNYRAWRYTVSLSDFYLSVDIQDVGSSTNSNSGVVFRNDEAGNYYYFGVDQKQQAYFFNMLYNDAWVKLVKFTYSSVIETSKKNTLEVVARGETFYLFINNKLVATVIDDTLKNGPMGLAIEINNPDQTGVFEFDNVELRAP